MNSHSPFRRPRVALPWLLLVGCASAPEQQAASSRDVSWLVAHGEYERAVKVAAEERRDHPKDPQALEDHRLASTALLLARGRAKYLADDVSGARAEFQAAQAIAPDVESVQDWIRATTDKLADLWFDRALARHVDDDLDGAIEAYEESLKYRPGDVRASESLGRALLQQNHRRGLGANYYDEGIMALNRYYLYEASSMFAYVLKYEPDNERADKRSNHTREMLAGQRAALAGGMEDDGQFAAARNEYRIALLLDPTLDAAKDGMARAAREAEARDALRKASGLALQKRFDEAATALREGRALSQKQQADFDAAETALVEAHLSERYESARRLESDARYEEAVAAYAELLEAAPFYKDAIARKDTLESYVQEAGELYDQAEAAQDSAEKVALLRRIAVFWPEYRDVSLQLAQLESRATP